MKIITIVGARPQFIKAAAVSREISRHPEIEEVIVHTGQHFDDNMSRVFFEEMEIPESKYNLKVNSLSHGVMTGKMLAGLEPVIQKENPDYETEWVELVENGFNVITGNTKQSIIDVFVKTKGKILQFNGNLYGNGMAIKRVVEIIRISN